MTSHIQPHGLDDKSRWPLSSARYALQFGLSALLGGLIWATSERLTGEVEPWDHWSGFYFAALFLGCLCIGVISPVSGFWVTAAGCFLGQILYMELVYAPPTARIFPSWIGVPIFSGVPVIIGSVLGGMFHSYVTISRK